MDFSRLGFVCLYVADLRLARGFYENVLGLRVEHEEPGFIQFSTGSVKFAIEPGGIKKLPRKEVDSNPFLLQFIVTSRSELSEMTAYLVSAGVQVLDRMRDTDYGVLTNFTDPDGNKLELLCREG
jgi:predicted enzyme related to lactoylglutathione lyase